MQPTIAVFGASGALGKAVVSYLSEKDATVHGFDHRVCDITSRLEVATLLRHYKPDVVINCAGVIPERSVNDPTGAAMIAANAIGPRVLANVTANLYQKLIHVSTDCVFAPNAKIKDVVDTPDAYDLYGMSKALGEIESSHITTVRCSFVTPDHGVARWFLTQPYEATVQGFTHKDWNGSTVEEIARHLSEFALNYERPAYGIHHIASRQFNGNKWEVLRILQQNFRPDITIEEVKGPSGHLLWPTIECRRFSEAIHDEGVRESYRRVALEVLNV